MYRMKEDVGLSEMPTSGPRICRREGWSMPTYTWQGRAMVQDCKGRRVVAYPGTPIQKYSAPVPALLCSSGGLS